MKSVAKTSRANKPPSLLALARTTLTLARTTLTLARTALTLARLALAVLFPTLARPAPTLARLALAALLLTPSLIDKPPAARDTRSAKAINLGLPNWSGQDYAPQISPDGQYVVFQSDRPGARDGHDLWFSVNTNYRDRLGAPNWTVPLPFFLPMDGDPTKTMRIVRGRFSLKNPPGAFSVNTDGFEGMASILYRKGRPRELYFTSLRDDLTKRDGYDGLNIYRAIYRDKRWFPPEHLNVINSHFDDRMPCISHDGKRLYFVSDRPGGYGGNDIWMSSRNSITGNWSRPRNMGAEINTEYNEISPGLTARGNILFFSSDRPGGFGHYDLYASRFDGHVWTAPKNLGAPFNTSRDEESISVTEDGLWAYFASDRRDADDARGGFDLYRLRLPEWLREPDDVLFTGLVLDGKSRLPLGIEATIKIDFERGTLIAVSRIFQKSPDEDPTQTFSNFEVKLTAGRIYQVEVSAPGYNPERLVLDYTGNVPPSRIDRRVIVLEPIRKEPVVEIKYLDLPGRVVDEKTDQGIPNSVVEYQVPGKSPRTFPVDKRGHFVIRTKTGDVFELVGSAVGYKPTRRKFTVDPNLKEIVLRLSRIEKPSTDPCEKDLQGCLDNIKIHFDLNKSDIKPSEMAKLEQAARIMKMFPEVAINILGHADKTYMGKKDKSFKYNQRLSQERARNVRAALAQLGIEKKRLKIIGYSYLKPLCKGDSPECLRLNRRVEFRRIKK